MPVTRPCPPHPLRRSVSSKASFRILAFKKQTYSLQISWDLSQHHRKKSQAARWRGIWEIKQKRVQKRSHWGWILHSVGERERELAVTWVWLTVRKGSQISDLECGVKRVWIINVCGREDSNGASRGLSGRKCIAAKPRDLSWSPEPTWWTEGTNPGACPLTSTHSHTQTDTWMRRMPSK